jgi:predicted dehydrogenase
MGLRHARAFAGLPDRFEIVGAYDVRSDAPLPDFAQRLRSEEEAIARGEVLVVATPNSAHAGVAGRALAAGRHVLVEKPLCATAAEARELAGLATLAAGRLFVGHSERFNPVVRVLARLLRREALLAIDLLRVGPGRATDCGVLVNLGVHDLDLATYLGGAPLVVRAAVGSAGSRHAGEDLAHVLFTTAGGAAGHLCVDRTAPTKRRQIALATSRWLYEGDLLVHRLVRTERATGVRTDVPLPLGEPLMAQALALADALDRPVSGGRHGQASEIATGHDGAYAVALAEGAAALVHFDPIESRAREKLVAAKAPLIPRE